MDHIIAECQQQPCSSKDCELCSYRSMDDARIDSELKSKKRLIFISNHSAFSYFFSGSK
jgi:hypothetical protein